MTLRTKILLIIIGIISLVVVTTIGASLYFMRSGIEQIIMGDISMIRDITNELMTSEINLIKSKAVASANRLKSSPMDRWNAILKEEVESSDIFKSFTIFERNGLVVASYGRPQAPQDLLFSDFSKKVFNGVSLISTTYRDSSGELVFYVCVPLAQMILSATIPGMYFTQMLEKFRVWESGSIFIIDNEGAIIANKHHYYVLNRYNCLRDPNQDRDTLSVQTFTRRMLRNHEGTGRYRFEGLELLGVFVHITASDSGWVLAVSAPIAESPAAFINRVLMVMTFVFLLLGVLLAYFASAFVDKQFKTINDQYVHLAKLSAIAQSASEAKSHFLANMSHEMRTPLNAIIGFSELMLQGRSDAAEREGDLKRIHHAGINLLSLVNDILDISKIESGKFQLVPGEYDVASVINDTVTVNLPRAGEKPVRFVLNVDPALPSKLVGDDLRIRQILNNLLSNAFKFTMEGEVELRATGWMERADFWLSFKVTDTGIGIRQEDQAKLFSDYNQMDLRKNRAIEGTGLGLSITKSLVELMDGTIQVDSRIGRGTAFTVTIRQTVAGSAPLGERVAKSLENRWPARVRHAPRDGFKASPMPYAAVLVVDDVPANLDVVRGLLKPYQLTVDYATSGREALALVRSGKIRYSAIFMDQMMPDQDGVETLQAIRSLPGQYPRTVPIIALTANAIVGNEERLLAEGFSAFMAKPIDLRLLDEVLNQFVADASKEADYQAELESKAQEAERAVKKSLASSSSDRSERAAAASLAQEAALKAEGGRSEASAASASKTSAQADKAQAKQTGLISRAGQTRQAGQIMHANLLARISSPAQDEDSEGDLAGGAPPASLGAAPLSDLGLSIGTSTTAEAAIKIISNAMKGPGGVNGGTPKALERKTCSPEQGERVFGKLDSGAPGPGSGGPAADRIGESFSSGGAPQGAKTPSAPFSSSPDSRTRASESWASDSPKIDAPETGLDETEARETGPPEAAAQKASARETGPHVSKAGIDQSEIAISEGAFSEDSLADSGGGGKTAGDLKVDRAAKDVVDIDLAEGLKRFAGNRNVYYEVLRSYRDSVSDLLEHINDPTPENLKNYTIVIHGLKSSSYGVCAQKIGKLAEDLENKAADGDLDYVLANNPNLLYAVDNMMSSLERFFDVVGKKRGAKPEKAAPDPGVVARLREACRTYDMDGVDSAISELEAYRYKGDPRLTDWLKDRAEVMDFKGILDRFPAA